MIKQEQRTRVRMNPHLKIALRVYVPLRVIASIWAILVISLLPIGGMNNRFIPSDLVVAAPHNSTLSTWLIKPWFRWDTQWFTAIAKDGYGYERPGSTAFLPLYPLLIGLLGRALAGEYLLAALIVSNIAAVVALALLHKLVTEHRNKRTANYTLAYLALFPTSFFLIAAYTESLFLALVLAAFLLVERKHWWLAALCGALAILTRWQGMALIPALALYALRGNRRALLAMGLMPLAFLGIVAFFWLFGGADALPWRQQTNPLWQSTVTWPWRAWIRTGLSLFGALPTENSSITTASNWVITAWFYALLIQYTRHGAIPYAIYAWCAHLITACRIAADSTLLSMPRFVLVLFPAFMLMAMHGKRHPWFNRVYVYMGAIFWLIFCTMFVLWYSIA
jgi:Gpi18-like mannosyltransferase